MGSIRDKIDLSEACLMGFKKSDLKLNEIRFLRDHKFFICSSATFHFFMYEYLNGANLEEIILTGEEYTKEKNLVSRLCH